MIQIPLPFRSRHIPAHRLSWLRAAACLAARSSRLPASRATAPASGVHAGQGSPVTPSWFRTGPLLSTLALLAFFFVLSAGSCLAQIPVDSPVTDTERSAVVERMATLLEERYVFPELGSRMADSLRHDERGRRFSGIEGAEALAGALSDRVRSLSGDGHLWVAVHAEPAEESGEERTQERIDEPEKDLPERREHAEPELPPHLVRSNFGFPKAEILPGNVGYLDVRQFVDPGMGGETAAAAMAYLAHAEALLLDLRRSMGGSQAMVALLASYFFEEGARIHLFDTYHRPSHRTVQSWTLDPLPARRFTDRPLYILTAAGTFSAGEGLAYILKHLERATVVGETTGGGANPGAFHRLNPRFMMFVAESRVTSPVTGDNWEGRGVRPDVAVPADAALEHAHRRALERMRASEEDDVRRRELDGLIEAFEPQPPQPGGSAGSPAGDRGRRGG